MLGHALIEWGNVEVQLQYIFRHLLDIDHEVASVVWGTVVSMDARITMTQKVIALRHPDTEIYSDAVLLLAEARTRYANRNELAHASLAIAVGAEEDGPFLSPFWVMGTEPRQLLTRDIAERAVKFERLAKALSWLGLMLSIKKHPLKASPKRPQASAPPPPDLVPELRAEESRRRREQSEREKLLRHAVRLGADGRLPDWPPK